MSAQSAVLIRRLLIHIANASPLPGLACSPGSPKLSFPLRRGPSIPPNLGIGWENQFSAGASAASAGLVLFLQRAVAVTQRGPPFSGRQPSRPVVQPRRVQLEPLPRCLLQLCQRLHLHPHLHPRLDGVGTPEGRKEAEVGAGKSGHSPVGGGWTISGEETNSVVPPGCWGPWARARASRSRHGAPGAAPCSQHMPPDGSQPPTLGR